MTPDQQVNGLRRLGPRVWGYRDHGHPAGESIGIWRSRRAAVRGPIVTGSDSGIGRAELLLDVPYERWRAILAVDLDAAFLCLQRATRRMVAVGRGDRIVNVTSVHEHAPRVGAAPGEIATPMTGQDDTDVAEVQRPGVPLGRPGDVREVAHLREDDWRRP